MQDYVYHEGIDIDSLIKHQPPHTHCRVSTCEKDKEHTE